MILAVKKDSKFFYLAFPFFIFAFLTRYTSALLIFPIFLYILFNKERINIKNILIGIGVSILTLVPVLIYFYKTFGNIIYPFISFGSTSTIVSVSAQNPYYNPNIFFFLQNFTSFVGTQGTIILLIIILGLILWLIIRLRTRIRTKKNDMDFFVLKSRSNLKYLIFLILGIVFLLSFGKISYVLSELLFFVVAIIFYDITKNKLKDVDLHLMFVSWFMAFFIFHSIFVIKDVRYFVVMAPPVVYFLIFGLSQVMGKINFMIKNRNAVLHLIALFLTSVMLISAASEIPYILKANNDSVNFNKQIEMASQWFVSYDPDYKDKIIYSDLWPNFSWYLKTDVKPVPVFNGNQTFLTGMINFSFNQLDSNKFNQYLVGNNADYYFSVRQGLNLTSYTQIKQFGSLIIYKKNN